MKYQVTLKSSLILAIPLVIGITALAQDPAPKPPTPVFKASRPKPAANENVHDIESLLTPPPGFRLQRRNNFYRTEDTANGKLYRWSASGHWSNYDEAEVEKFTLPDPLTMSNGRKVTTAKMWTEQRRPEIIKLYESEVYGKVPLTAPKVEWILVSYRNDGKTITKEIVGHIAGTPMPAMSSLPAPVVQAGRGAPAAPAAAPAPVAAAPAGRGAGAPIPPPSIRINLTLPADAKGPVPVILGGGGGNAAAILARGWGYGNVNTGAIQRDSADPATLRTGVVGMTLKPGVPRPGDEWGVLRAWAWGWSRAMDYLETDKQVDAKQVAISGHSRGGKTVLLAAAMDSRFALVFPTCSGEMGASLSRRDWGETIDDMAQLFAPHFNGNFLKYQGKWNDLPVDSHMLLALVAPRPVFITGGTEDQWSDPKGQFQAAVAAGPVFKLLGKKDLGVTEMPKPDTALVAGDIAFHEHTGGHVVTPAEWELFLKFADKYFKAPAAK